MCAAPSPCCPGSKRESLIPPDRPGTQLDIATQRAGGTYIAMFVERECILCLGEQQTSTHQSKDCLSKSNARDLPSILNLVANKTSLVISLTYVCMLGMKKNTGTFEVICAV